MKKSSTHDCDILIIGAGPAGLCLARALADSGLNIVLVEKSPLAILENPPIDGRDIALTHLSNKIMQDLDIWQNIPKDDISVIKEAKVLNGTSSYALHFHHQEAGSSNLGWLVPNHLIRRAAFLSVRKYKNIKIISETSAVKIEDGAFYSSVYLSNGQTYNAKLVAAADSRFSETRKKVGIQANIHDFKRVCIVCEVEHEKNHANTAYECFHFGQTLAILPLKGKKSSVVITLPSDKADDVLNMSEDEFNRDIQERFENRLGWIKLYGKRHAYPLAGVHADRFIAKRYALIGDAAVGMHPVTAHGFNLGLRGAHTLAQEIKSALHLGLDIGSNTVLEKYERQHRRATRPMYVGTNALVKLYTSEGLPAKIMRSALLRLGNKITPVRRAIMGQLTEIK